MTKNSSYSTTIQTKDGKPIVVDVKFDKRLKKSLRYEQRGNGSILLRVPERTSQHVIQNSIKQIEKTIQNEKYKRKGRTDDDLQVRADFLNKHYLKNQINWTSIRWVNNMKYRLGSCTTGGPTDGHIRISSVIKNYPQYVIDYVIVHELSHRIYPNHSKEFWHFVKSHYPNTDKAIGFIEGIGFAKGVQFEDD
jgi:hypothetical protein